MPLRLPRRILTRLLGASLTIACATTTTACTHTTPLRSGGDAIEPTAEQMQAAAKVGISKEELTALLNKPLYRMKPAEVGHYVAYLHAAQPDLRARIGDIARKNIGQPYELYLLGEFPYETTDDQPLFNLEKSDCVVFAEHTYAMALSQSWEEFFWMLQRIRYKDGVIGVTTRNHYTEQDWDRQNAWLVKDVSTELAGDRAGTYKMVVDRSKFLKKRYNLDRDIPVETTTESYVPKAMVSEIAGQLQQGDYVNVISGKDGDRWASHVGLVVVGANGERHFLHSSEPAVREETFESFIRRATEREARNAAAGKNEKVLFGFKFLRLNDNPDVPPMAPQPRPGPMPPPPAPQVSTIATPQL
jgi:hypothetical protein